MKNPFNEPARESWFCGTWDLSDREFCAHAINQHEKLVAERDGFTVDYCRVVDSLDECRARLAWVVEILGGDPNDGSSADSVSWSAWLSDEAVRLVTELVAERDELKRYVDKLPTYCAYCGFEVPIDDEAASKISEHIATCPKHPMRNVEAERDRLQVWVNDLHSQMYVNCIYCGHRYGPRDEVPAAMADVLKQHIEQCHKHPMSKLKARNDKLVEGVLFAKAQIRKGSPKKALPILAALLKEEKP